MLAFHESSRSGPRVLRTLMDAQPGRRAQAAANTRARRVVGAWYIRVAPGSNAARTIPCYGSRSRGSTGAAQAGSGKSLPACAAPGVITQRGRRLVARRFPLPSRERKRQPSPPDCSVRELPLELLEVCGARL